MTAQALLLKTDRIFPKVGLPNKNLISKLLIVIITLIIILANGGFMLNILGGANYTYNYARVMPPMQVPYSYYQLLHYLENSNSNGFYVLALPFQGYVTYNWHPCDTYLIASPVLLHFVPLPCVAAPVHPLLVTIEENLRHGTPKIAAKMMANLSIKYVVVSKDLRTNYARDVAYLHYIHSLNLHPDIFVLRMNTTEFSLYELQDPPPIPIVFTTKDISIPTPEVNLVTFNIVSPREYVINANSTAPFYIILNQKYDSNWVAYCDGKQVNTHLRYQGYANAWYVNKTGKITLKLCYLSQPIIFPFLLVSLLFPFLLVSLLYEVQNILQGQVAKNTLPPRLNER
jgi:hypothetical protein